MAGAGVRSGSRWRRRIGGLLAALGTAAALTAGPGAVTAAAATATLGNTAVGPSTDTADSNYLNASRYVTGAAGGTVSSVSVYVGAVDTAPNNQFQVAVYRDNAGSPGALLASSASAALTADSWNTVPLTAALSANTAYWLAYNSNGGNAAVNNLRYSPGGTSVYGNGGRAFGSWPADFGAATSSGLSFSIYATYTADETPPPPPPGSGPGGEGPILLVTSQANPYTRYLGEILKAEGLNYYRTVDLSAVTSSLLASYDVVLLGETPLTAAQATVFTTWTNGGGRLVAMRPDRQLAPLFGLTPAGGTRSDAYLKVDTSAAPGTGITGDTMGYHGAADLYTLSGATAVATLYSDAGTATANPAVTLRTAGGGRAAAFSYDLAKSVVQTRQGNAAWAGQQRDGTDGYEASEMFFGTGGQPDWNNLDKALIPIADEQQRLLANLITLVDAANKPLPRFWYFPRDVKAVVVMTGDDHGIGGTAGRWDGYIAQSPPGCNVADWECVRGSSYIYTDDPLTPAQAKAYTDQGFEVGVHVTTNCRPWGTTAALQGYYRDQLANWRAKYPALPAPSSSRTHCVEWDDWATQAKTKLANGIRLDTDYYFYPSTFTKDRPGYFNGTAQIMRFADTDGSVIDEYQATTQLTDESGQSYPGTITTLLDAAYGAKGYYAALTANLHTDYAASAASDAVVAAAKARGVPVVSGRQMLTWLDGRNGSAFSKLAWSGSSLTFEITGGANGLRAMVPVSAASGTLTGISSGGRAVPYRIETVKGVSYAFFDGAVGAYTASYGRDTTAPTVTGTTPAAGATGVAPGTAVRFSFGEPLDPASVTASSVTLRTAGGAAVAGTVAYDTAANGVVFTPGSPLALTTGHTATVQGVRDTSGNALASPFTLSFTTGGAAPRTLGNTAVGSLIDDTDSHHLNGSRVTTGSGPVPLTALSVHVGPVSAAPNNQYQLAVYTDAGGSPGTLVTTTAVGTLTPNAWNSLPVTTTLSANTAYWFVYNSNGTGATVNNMNYSTGPAGSGAYSNAVVPFGTWPTAFGPAVKDTLLYSLYGSY
ncbi:Ig-like domain-containing protein [Kitasatospora sp. CM 4170]|uniref:Ig-like domain-containing protein n=1 Tax=Kitasatospora aburaviensis TaxID=67265 RepID=A0ABW1F2D1_9ACTN|nr:Ig-like domain-containing protein [Kitasatospora sp. CM 4170]WNM47942.1 Ig-like domain-containing protein [Kitasatospora sp. CM 4170]